MTSSDATSFFDLKFEISMMGIKLFINLFAIYDNNMCVEFKQNKGILNFSKVQVIIFKTFLFNL